MIYQFKCDKCKKTKEIDVQVSEYYIPDCSKCNDKMKRVYSVNLISGVLDRNNLPK